MGAERRIAVVLLGLAVSASGCGGGGGARPAAPVMPDAPSPWRADRLDRVQRARAAAADEAWRRAELARIADSPTVGAALRRALLQQAIGRREHDRYRAAYDGGRKAARRLAGARRDEQAAVVSSVEQLAAAHRLTASRLPAVFLNLRRNTRTWTQAPFPRAGERRSFGDDAAVFQYVLGHGQLAAASVPLHARRRLRAAAAAAAARRARAPGRAARRLPRVGVLLRVRAGDAALDQRHDAVDGRAGAVARAVRAPRAALRGAGPARARGVRDA